MAKLLMGLALAISGVFSHDLTPDLSVDFINRQRSNKGGKRTPPRDAKGAKDSRSNYPPGNSNGGASKSTKGSSITDLGR